MISLTKEEIAKYLKDYSFMSESIRNNPDMKIGALYRNYMLNSNRIEEYLNNSFIKMIRVYGLMTEMRLFSFKEDLAIDYLNNDELDFDEVKEKIFVNPNDARRFSKKQIVRYIRNSVNHSDYDKQLYSISVNGRYIECNLRQTNPPFHVKLNYEQLSKIHDETFKRSHNILMASIDYDSFDFSKPWDDRNFENLEFVQFYFPKKISFDAIQSLYNTDFSMCETSREKFEKASEVLIEHDCNNFRINRYPVTDIQKAKMKSILENLKNIDLNKMDINALKSSIEHVLDDTIPLGMYHTDQLYYEQQFAAWFMSDENLSYNEILNKIKSICNGEEFVPTKNVSDDYNKFDKERYDALHFGINKHILQYTLMTADHKSRVMYPISLFLGYIADSLFDEEIITVEGKEYKSEKIRNSFVHGRWYFGTKDMIELYDIEPEDEDQILNNDTIIDNNEDVNNMFGIFKWHKSINLRQLLSAMNNLYEQKEHDNHSIIK